MSNKLRKRTTGAQAGEVRASLMRILDRRLVSRGDILFPCVPALADEFSAKLISVWTALGRPVSSAQGDELRRCMRTALAAGYEASPNGAIQVSWQAHSTTDGLINYLIDLQPSTLDEKYNEWLQGRTGPLFGVLPDAKVMSIASSLGDPSAAPVLDVGAGTGRNALALAANGHPTDAVEAVPEFCKKIRESAANASHPVRVLQADVLSGELQLESSRYRLAVASEVLPHFGSADEARLLFEKLADALAPGGLLVFNAFLGRNGYEPDSVARQLGHTYFTSLFSRKDFACLVDELPFELVSDESAYEFEKANSAPSAWPPTTWFESWSQGSNIFDVPVGKAPVELRWLVYRRK
jgi:SAM-dependent methyltransferase